MMRGLFIVLALISILMMAGCPKKDAAAPAGGTQNDPAAEAGEGE